MMPEPEKVIKAVRDLIKQFRIKGHEGQFVVHYARDLQKLMLDDCYIEELGYRTLKEHIEDIPGVRRVKKNKEHDNDTWIEVEAVNLARWDG